MNKIANIKCHSSTFIKPKKTEKKENDFNVYTNTNRQQTMKRFKTKSQNNEVIDGDYEIINENDKNKN